MMVNLQVNKIPQSRALSNLGRFTLTWDMDDGIELVTSGLSKLSSGRLLRFLRYTVPGCLMYRNYSLFLVVKNESKENDSGL